jgi:MqsR (Motility quorum-sensing regulator) toxin of toxin-antitoxin system
MAKLPKTPKYPLEEVKRLVRAKAWRLTGSAEDSARVELGMMGPQVLQCVLSLKASDFYKQMESDKCPGLWQDVYRPTVVAPLHQGGVVVYCKVQIDAGVTVVISFKVK